jgi:U3 small nucleolar RNA-associated protein 23
MKTTIVITQCSIQALYDLGTEGQASVDLAKDFERRKCNHFKVRPEEECLITMAGALHSLRLRE